MTNATDPKKNIPWSAVIGALDLYFSTGAGPEWLARYNELALDDRYAFHALGYFGDSDARRATIEAHVRRQITPSTQAEEGEGRTDAPKGERASTTD